MPVINAQGSPNSNLPSSGSITIPYPDGVTSSTFVSLIDSRVAVNGNDIYSSASGAVSVTASASGFLVVNNTGNVWPKGSRLIVSVRYADAATSASSSLVADCVFGYDGVVTSTTISSATFYFDDSYVGKDLYIRDVWCRITSVESGVARFSVVQPPQGQVDFAVGSLSEDATTVDGRTDATLVGDQLSSPTYSFATAGVTVYINNVKCNIDSVSSGVATISVNNVSTGSARRWWAGTDNTAAIEALMTAAGNGRLPVGDSSTLESFQVGGFKYGSVVHLPAGAYLVRNTFSRFAAGKRAAIVVKRKCGLEGAGHAQTQIHVAPGSPGHGICNENAGLTNGGYSDFMSIKDFSLFCSAEFQLRGHALSGLHLRVQPSNYVKVDPFNRVHNVYVWEARQDGIYARGRGEIFFFDCFTYGCYRYGMYLDTMNDFAVTNCNSGGNSKTGIRVNNSVPGRLVSCKSFFNGNGGGSVDADCANFALISDSWTNGKVNLIGCESQECRGSGFYVESGANVFNGCTSADPGRSSMIAGSPPTIRAGFHLKGYTNDRMPHYNNFINCVVRADLTTNYNDLAGSFYGGTHAVYIDGSGIKGTTGDIFVNPQVAYDTAVLDGTGFTSGLNPGLRINGVVQTGPVYAAPPAPTGLVLTPGAGQCAMSWTAPATNGGSAITDYRVEWRLNNTGSVWTTFADGVSTSTTATITGLPAGTHGFRVSAINAIGRGVSVSGVATVT